MKGSISFLFEHRERKMLTIEQVARHYGLSNSTVARRIKSGDLHASRVNRSLRLTWEDVWACE